MNLSVLEVDHLEIPESEYGSIVQLSSGEFSRICKELFTLSDTLFVVTDKNSVRFEVKGNEVGGQIVMEMNDSSDLAERVLLEVVEPVNLSFALRYLNMFVKATPLSEQVMLSMSSEYPLMVQYDLPNALGFIRFYLAPRITEDNN